MKSLTEILLDPSISKEDKEIALDSFAPLGAGSEKTSPAVRGAYAARNQAAADLAAEGRKDREKETKKQP